MISLGGSNPPLSAEKREEMIICKIEEARIITFLRDCKRMAKADGFVIGLSGGIDSSLVAVLAAKAIAPQSIIGVAMSCHTSQDDFILARELSEALKVQFKSIPLEYIREEIKAFTGTTGKILNIPDGNLAARLRMSVLYYLANLNNYLVLGTGNRSESFVGYFTKYGDGAADVMPIAHLTKREVYELSRYLQIDERIISKAPSAGLWEGQTDESELGFSYNELDNYLLNTGVPATKFKDKVIDIHLNTWHKRTTPLKLECW